MCTNSNTDVSCKHNLIKIPTLKMKQYPYNKRRKVRIICGLFFNCTNTSIKALLSAKMHTGAHVLILSSRATGDENAGSRYDLTSGCM